MLSLSLSILERAMKKNNPKSPKRKEKKYMPTKGTNPIELSNLTSTLTSRDPLVELCSDLSNSAAGHSEDRFIDEVLPANVAFLSTTTDNVIHIGINRSPCTSTDHCGNGCPSCNKGPGASGCAERLIHLVTHGFTHGVLTYPIKLVISVRNLYGDSAEKQANSSMAIDAMNATGRIQCDSIRLAESTRFMGTKAAGML